MTAKKFQSACEWKQLINNDSQRLHIKDNELVPKLYEKISKNNWQKIHEHNQEFKEIDQSCARVIGEFYHKKLRTIDENINFIEREAQQGNVTIF